MVYFCISGEVRYHAEFAQAIQERHPPSCTVTDGRRVLKVLDACKSERTSQPVRIG